MTDSGPASRERCENSRIAAAMPIAKRPTKWIGKIIVRGSMQKNNAGIARKSSCQHCLERPEFITGRN